MYDYANNATCLRLLRTRKFMIQNITLSACLCHEFKASGFGIESDVGGSAVLKANK